MNTCYKIETFSYITLLGLQDIINNWLKENANKIRSIEKIVINQTNDNGKYWGYIFYIDEYDYENEELEDITAINVAIPNSDYDYYAYLREPMFVD